MFSFRPRQFLRRVLKIEHSIVYVDIYFSFINNNSLINCIVFQLFIGIVQETWAIFHWKIMVA